MRFRTEIETIKADFSISHSDRILLLGSCFSDNIGQRLSQDGFNVCVNPFGPLYNPVSLARLLTILLNDIKYGESDLYRDDKGTYHCLDFAMRYQNANVDELIETLNRQLDEIKSFLENTSVLCLTFGSSQAFLMNNEIVGNCHKLDSRMFKLCSVSETEIADMWRPLLDQVHKRGIKVIATVSPIRHLAYGLHGNQLGKARLLLALDRLTDYLSYFPSYEIVLDDLRDYRFYAADMKHPSDVACDYIYEKFSLAYFSPETIITAAEYRKASLKAAHRPLL